MTYEEYIKFHFTTTSYTPTIDQVKHEIDLLLDDYNDAMLLWTIFNDVDYLEDAKATLRVIQRNSYKLKAIQSDHNITLDAC